MENLEVLPMVDLIFVVLISISLVVGVLRGFFQEVTSLASWILAIWLAYRFGPDGAQWLNETVENATVSSIISTLVIFLGVFVVLSVISELVNHLIRKAGLSFTDRALGAAFGFLRGVVLLATLLALARLTTFPDQDWYNSSQLIPFFDPLVDRLSEHVSGSLLKDVQSTVSGALDGNTSSSTE